ncbi:tyrosine-protein phosphatase [Leucobacter sp. CSA2]|uniref:Tyrosine-protein phosphatase n=1 Tax=Leucobacter edaphi TaxID=2796472 RepID=A0A934QBQ4_9MICO|nr:tyrosine-protein phosphatase [Leucobacter edaphi]MBK0421740.1 tyrosine-protein phosphatase [Leucobacter edaphi]
MTTTTERPAAGRPIRIAGTHNFRSTAGYRARGGSLSNRGLFRSDALDALDDSGREAFAEQGISRVIDLRSTEELRSAPSALPIGSVEAVHHPIFDSAGLPDAGTPISLVDVYAHVIRERVPRLAGAVGLIADAPAGGVLVHCTAGKDRTGLVVAAALTAVGVERDQVLADYEASGRNLAGEWAERMLDGAERRFGPLDPSARELLIASPAEALDRTFDLIDELHGGVVPMLRGAGLDRAALERLEERLVD